jgi:hypothetical protein
MTLTLKKAIVRERHLHGASWWEVLFHNGDIETFVGEDAEYRAKETAARWNEEYVTGNMDIGGYDE